MNIFSEYKGLRKEMYILCIGRMMTNMGQMIFPMLTLILNKKLGMSAGTIAIYMTLFGIISMPINLIGGKLADKISKKNIIIFCDIVSISTYFYCACKEITMSALLIFATGALFQMVESPSYDALVADLTNSKDRERAFSLQYLGSNLGFVLAPTIGGLLFENHLNLAFLINGLAIASSTLLIFFFLKDISKAKESEINEAYEAVLDEGVSTLSYILKSRVILLYIIGSAIGQGVYSMFNFLMPLTMGFVHGSLGSVIFRTMTSVNCIIVVVFTALITKWFRKVCDTNKIFLGEVMILLGYLLFTLYTGNTLICYISMVIFTFGEIFMTLSSFPFLTRRIPSSHRGRIMAVSNVSGAIFTSVFQLLIGRLYDLEGHTIAWLFVIAIGCIYLVEILVLARFDRIDFHGLYEN